MKSAGSAQGSVVKSQALTSYGFPLTSDPPVRSESLRDVAYHKPESLTPCYGSPSVVPEFQSSRLNRFLACHAIQLKIILTPLPVGQRACARSDAPGQRAGL